jgi:hypothetical protein
LALFDPVVFFLEQTIADLEAVWVWLDPFQSVAPQVQFQDFRPGQDALYGSGEQFLNAEDISAAIPGRGDPGQVGKSRNKIIPPQVTIRKIGFMA